MQLNLFYFGDGWGLFLLRSALSRLSLSALSLSDFSLPLSALSYCVLDEAIVSSRVSRFKNNRYECAQTTRLVLVVRTLVSRFVWDDTTVFS